MPRHPVLGRTWEPAKLLQSRLHYTLCILPTNSSLWHKGRKKRERDALQQQATHLCTGQQTTSAATHDSTCKHERPQQTRHASETQCWKSVTLLQSPHATDETRLLTWTFGECQTPEIDHKGLSLCPAGRTARTTAVQRKVTIVRVS